MLNSVWFSVALLCADLIVIGLIWRWQKRPIVPGKVGLIPRNVVGLFQLILVIIGFAILAHIISLITGVQVKPKRKMGM